MFDSGAVLVSAGRRLPGAGQVLAAEAFLSCGCALDIAFGLPEDSEFACQVAMCTSNPNEDDTRVVLAGREAMRVKRLVQGIRYLYRNGAWACLGCPCHDIKIGQNIHAWPFAM